MLEVSEKLPQGEHRSHSLEGETLYPPSRPCLTLPHPTGITAFEAQCERS